jgi:hypothetical protein
MGKTPIVYSLLEARGDFPPELERKKTIVLISDGEETCGGNLADVERAYRGSDFEIVVHVVGFDIRGTEAERQLRSIAAMCKGRYYGAASSKELADALIDAIRPEGFSVFSPGGGGRVAAGPLNGPPIELPPGPYGVGVDGMPGSVLNITVLPGCIATLRVLGDGRLILEQE